MKRKRLDEDVQIADLILDKDICRRFGFDDIAASIECAEDRNESGLLAKPVEDEALLEDELEDFVDRAENWRKLLDGSEFARMTTDGPKLEDVEGMMRI